MSSFFADIRNSVHLHSSLKPIKTISLITKHHNWIPLCILTASHHNKAEMLSPLTETLLFTLLPLLMQFQIVTYFSEWKLEQVSLKANTLIKRFYVQWVIYMQINTMPCFSICMLMLLLFLFQSGHSSGASQWKLLSVLFWILYRSLGEIFGRIRLHLWIGESWGW